MLTTDNNVPSRAHKGQEIAVSQRKDKLLVWQTTSSFAAAATAVAAVIVEAYGGLSVFAALHAVSRSARPPQNDQLDA
jgi:predicted protein tyrosine phosphatase